LPAKGTKGGDDTAQAPPAFHAVRNLQSGRQPAMGIEEGRYGITLLHVPTVRTFW